MVNGKKYVLSIGEHTSVIKRDNGILAYLELQDGKDSNWYVWSNETYKRFGFHNEADYKKVGYENGESFLIDCDELQNSSEFEILLGFLNRG